MKRNKRGMLIGLVSGLIAVGVIVAGYWQSRDIPFIKAELEKRERLRSEVRKLNPQTPEDLDRTMHQAYQIVHGQGLYMFSIRERECVELMTRVELPPAHIGPTYTYKPWARSADFRAKVARDFKPSIWDINYMSPGIPWGSPHHDEYLTELDRAYRGWLDWRNWRPYVRFGTPAAVMALFVWLGAILPFLAICVLMFLAPLFGLRGSPKPASDTGPKIAQLVSDPGGSTEPQPVPVSVEALVSDPSVGWLAVMAMFMVVTVADVRRQIRTMIVRGSRAPPHWRCTMKRTFGLVAALCVMTCVLFVVPAVAAEVDLWCGEWNTGRGAALIYIYDAPNGKFSSIPSVTLSGSAFEELAQGHLNLGPFQVTPAVAGGTMNTVEGTRMFLGGEFGTSVAYHQFTLAGNYADRWSNASRLYDLVTVNLDATWSPRLSTRLGYQPVRYTAPEWDHRLMGRVSRQFRFYRLGTEFRMSVAHPHRLSGMVMVSRDLGK